MAQIIVDQRDMEFALYEQLEAETLCHNSHFSDFNRKTFDMILNEARNLAVKEILPTFTEGDRRGCGSKTIKCLFRSVSNARISFLLKVNGSRSPLTRRWADKACRISLLRQPMPNTTWLRTSLIWCWPALTMPQRGPKGCPCTSYPKSG
jgi:hypothetical protein